ncbi:3-ketoacyl-CoA synthase 13 [Striga asiatica]|uniref:3-ketoacyl-CoA synthase 13 n=1 Tax=Striga asiatica TaxID=4170 RepID=A0A5A7PG44_STRAF|nr:3-ketoacyl-CoA synthase 13 [Striga asiatica]
MAPKFGVVQEDYFYDLEWTLGMDTSFIDILLDEKSIGAFVPHSSNEESLATTTKRINASFGKNFTVSYMKYFLEILLKKHNTFSTLIRKHDVRYDEETNMLHASDNTWYELFRWEEFTLAYFEKGDPSWADLKALFHIEQPYVPPVELHIISDDDEGDVGKNVRVPKRSTTMMGVESNNNKFLHIK